MSRRQRQLNELRDLCSAGGVVRAIDLAFEHFAHFGRDDEIIDLLTRAIEDAEIAERARQRFAELCASRDRRALTDCSVTPPVLSTHADWRSRRTPGS